MKTVVVVPCRNEESTILSVLDAIAGQELRPHGVVIVDDGSTDNTRAVVERWAAAHPVPVTVVRSSGQGTGAAMNTGVTRADADIIIRLDGHCCPAPDYIARSIDTIDLPDAGVAGGVWRIEPGAPTLMARGIACVLSHPLGSGAAEYRRPPGAHAGTSLRAVDTVPFGTFRKSVWAEVGGFDESLVRNQDYDFNYRVRLTGRKVLLNPMIISAYKARPTLAALARQYFQYGYWKVVMLRKYPASILPRQFVPLLLTPAMLGLLVWGAAARTSVPLWGVAAFLGVNGAGAVQAALRAGDARLAPFAAAALVVLQTAWSAGAWLSVVSRPRR